MEIREATFNDICAMQRVRHAVKENVLSDPSLVPDEMVADFIGKRGKGWVAIEENQLVGFAIADLEEENIWALFIDPAFENRGIGKALHQIMLEWYFSQSKESVWLSTDSNSRAARFYRMQGWQEAGAYGKTETKFIFTKSDWKKNQQ